jgi:hypothetical protein
MSSQSVKVAPQGRRDQRYSSHAKLGISHTTPRGELGVHHGEAWELLVRASELDKACYEAFGEVIDRVGHPGGRGPGLR